MSSGPLILALDLATVTGFCVGRPGEKPRFGTWRLKGPEDSQERATRNLGCRLRDEFSVFRPDQVVVEAPISPAAIINMGSASHTASLLWMLYGAVGAVCGPYGIRQFEAKVQTVRKAVLGTGRPADPKKAVVRHCRILGYDVTDHNAADAMCLWFYQCDFRGGQLDLSAATSAEGGRNG